jgi:LysR family transcriptional regulator, glycine cleavage system transcriptional activator
VTFHVRWIHISELPLLPSLQALRVLDAAARLGSFSEAAAELGLTHGAVSHQVSALEAWTGITLFERRGRRMAPTAAALSMMARSRPALRALGEAFGRPGPPRPEAGLRITTVAAFARFWLLPRMLDAPQAWLELIGGIDTGAELADIGGGHLDAAIRYGPGGWRDLQSVRLGAERIFPVASPALAHQLAGRGRDWVEEAPLIGNAFVSWNGWFQAAGVSPRGAIKPVLEVADSGLALDAAVAGLGVALGRMRYCRRMIEDGRLAAVSNATLDDGYSYHLVWRPGVAKIARIEALLERLLIEFDNEPITILAGA